MLITGDISGLDFVTRDVGLDVFGQEMHRGGEALKRDQLVSRLHYIWIC